MQPSDENKKAAKRIGRFDVGIFMQWRKKIRQNRCGPTKIRAKKRPLKRDLFFNYVLVNVKIW